MSRAYEEFFFDNLGDFERLLHDISPNRSSWTFMPYETCVNQQQTLEDRPKGTGIGPQQFIDQLQSNGYQQATVIIGRCDTAVGTTDDQPLDALPPTPTRANFTFIEEVIKSAQKDDRLVLLSNDDLQLTFHFHDDTDPIRLDKQMHRHIETMLCCLCNPQIMSGRNILVATTGSPAPQRDFANAFQIFCRLSPVDGFHIVHLSAPWEILRSKDALLNTAVCYGVTTVYSRHLRITRRLPSDNVERFARFFRHTTNLEAECDAICNVLKSYSAELDTIIDVGCGDGTLLDSLKRNLSDDNFYYGIDNSARQIDFAQKKSTAIAFEVKDFVDLRIAPHEETAILFLGNTLPHIGVNAFREWLRDNKPAVIIFDFATYWRDMVERRQFKQVGTAPHFEAQLDNAAPPTDVATAEISADARLVLSSLTVLSNQCVLRKLELQWFLQSISRTSCVAKQAVTIEQRPDSPATYRHMLEASNYCVEEIGRYDTKWGEHDLLVAKITPGAGPRDWPTPRVKASSTILNDLWYSHLKELWWKIGAVRGQFHSVLRYSPIAILPFDDKRVFGRYFPRKDNSTSVTPPSIICDAWMWLVDEHDEHLSRGGLSKPENELPYACGFYRTLLADVPASFVRHSDNDRKSELGLALNEWDRRFEAEEHIWLNVEDEQTRNEIGQFTIPVYFDGLPLYVVIVTGFRSEWPPELIRQVLQQEADFLQDRLEQHWNWKEWSHFLHKAIAERVKLEEIERLCSVVTAEGRKWGNWLVTVPGRKLHDTASVKDKWECFQKEHKRVFHRVKENVGVKLSLLFEDCNFFVEAVDADTSHTGCGHERVTSRHREAAKGLQKELHQIPKVIDEFRPLSEFVNKFLMELQGCDKSELPNSDVDAPQACNSDSSDPQLEQWSERFAEMNRRFQQVKSLLCRTEMNRGEAYRLSPLTIATYIEVFCDRKPDIKIVDEHGAEDTFKTFTIEQVRPKIEVEDFWGWLCSVGKYVDAAGPSEITMNRTAGNTLVLNFKFGMPLPITAQGRGVSRIISAAERLSPMTSKSSLEQVRRDGAIRCDSVQLIIKQPHGNEEQFEIKWIGDTKGTAKMS